MFARSAASDTLQGKAIQAVNERWGEDSLQRSGRESIGIPVCKKKYAPFCFPTEQVRGRYQVGVERMYGCKCHHPIRKAVIEQHGLRPGWEPFGQWSLQKAREMARQEASRLNGEEDASSDEDDTSESESSSDAGVARNMCLNGNCSWKVKSAYDDIHEEIEAEAIAVR